ncbi:peptidoglycan-associated lipoprotein Pal [Rhodoferax aquaticus]|uniref:Peptidoglycan-associated lipoprotein n=1 Tax=Rhodoferax aquaticus TaxID=2527691 RepID=A0A515ENP9_9BURK|nr:peptidoglycan-associated lipoprotein Pal [Rhodoferax aquaticus]QDL54302.1 peptidoglycan-associated lipoprotein Pal [Rhodoferax aquaticus]
MKRIVLIVATSAFLVACGSSVKLDDVPVVDKSGTSVGASTASTTPDDSANTGVKRVEVGKSDVDPLKVAAKVVYFDYDSFQIRPEFQALIEAHARALKLDKSKKVAIEGHTDERGGREYNLALGQKRAEAVRKALALLGVADSQVEAVSFGKEKPAVLGDSEAAMEKNRRAEVSYR